MELLDEMICDETKSRRRGIARYKASIFRMYGGETEKVTLESDRSMIESIYDTFGAGTKIKDLRRVVQHKGRCAGQSYVLGLGVSVCGEDEGRWAEVGQAGIYLLA